MNQYRLLCLHKEDNVAVALTEIPAQTVVQLHVGTETVSLTVLEEIQFGHKLAIKQIKQGEEIKKYGEVIGIATQGIMPGQHVHVHNIKSKQGEEV